MVISPFTSHSNDRYGTSTFQHFKENIGVTYPSFQNMSFEINKPSLMLVLDFSCPSMTLCSVVLISNDNFFNTQILVISMLFNDKMIME